MLIFLHMHKCGGSTVVRKAEKSGLRLPEVHHNGNLLEADGETAVRYTGMTRETLQGHVEAQQKAGVEFFAMEWDFPVVEYLDGETPITLFTVLRDPFERAVSNFRFAKLCAWVPRGRSFQRFMNNGYSKLGPLARSSNYFTRKLCSVDALEALSRSHLTRAIEVLNRFDSVIFLGTRTMDDELARLGLTAQVKPAKDGTALRLRRSDIPDEDLAVSEADRDWFVNENGLDFELVSMLHAKKNSPDGISTVAVVSALSQTKGIS